MGTFIPNPLIGAQLKLEPTMGAVLLAEAEEVAAEAKRIAPVETGAYRDSLRAEGGIEGSSFVGRVLSDVPYAAYVEFGTMDTPAFHVLARAIESEGLGL